MQIFNPADKILFIPWTGPNKSPAFSRGLIPSSILIQTTTGFAAKCEVYAGLEPPITCESWLHVMSALTIANDYLTISRDLTSIAGDCERSGAKRSELARELYLM